MNDQHSPTINLNAELDHRINFAMQQNDVPVVKTVHIANRSHASLRELRLRITSEPDFAQPWETRIETHRRGIDLQP